MIDPGLEDSLKKEMAARKAAESRIARMKDEIADLRKKVLAGKGRALKAERSSYSKDVFLAKMSHEIRTPLNAIMGLGKLLAKTDLDSKQNYLLGSIQSASENLLVIINDILDFSKIEAGKVSLEHYGFDIKKIALQALNVFMHKAEEKGVSLFLEMDDRIAPILISDPYRINQVLMNMLSNAVKFTEAGSITLKITLLQEIKHHQKIQIEIKDTGVGINEDYLKRLFDMFSQEDNTVARKFGGTGLGMSISRQLVELMNGTLTVESRKNIGTTVYINFDFKIGSERDIIKPEEIDTDANSIQNKKILLVEDNSMNRLITVAYLQQHHAIIAEAEHGEQALQLLAKNKYDLILMDVQMPVMDGFEATRIIRNDMKITIPIVALTANALKGDDERCIKAGMNDFISKPYDEKKLLQVISKWLLAPGLDTSNNLAVNALNTLAPKASTEKVYYDLEKLKTIGNEDFINVMLKLFIREIPNSIKKIKDAYNSEDFDTVKYLVHRIRPSIINMGIVQLKNEVVQIEELAAKGIKTAQLGRMIDKMEHIINLVIERLKNEYDV
jgi:signal transduction histidine kinase/CheY-like chemotaxis protein/HPt (histidine-containing phosphotransfer) domain-containing protein